MSYQSTSAQSTSAPHDSGPVRNPHTEYSAYDDNFELSVSHLLASVGNKITALYQKALGVADDEFSVPVSQEQVNDALKKFVTDNVEQILELRVELHDHWFRLYCTVEASGVYAQIASNFGVVHAQLDRNVQRFVFSQKTYTDLLTLHCDSYLKKIGVKSALWFYHKILKKDPLGMILHKINLVRPKDNILYLDIGRWLKKNQKIMSALHKVQVNYGVTEEEQLIFKTQVNVRDLLSRANGEEIITPDDEPKIMQGPLNPIEDAIEPSLA